MHTQDMEGIMKKNNTVLNKENNIFPNIKAEHRWGYKDTKFVLQESGSVLVTGTRYPVSGYEMPFLTGLVENIMKCPFIPKKRPEVEVVLPKPKQNAAFLAMMKRKKYEKRLSFKDTDRLTHSHGQTTADEIMRVLYCGGLHKYADAVFFAVSAKEVEDLIKIALKTKVCLVPYGGGTSVSSSLTLPVDEKRMIVVVDTTALSRIIKLDKKNRYVSVEAGITGIELANYLAKHGYTTGHEPDSYEFSTVGGWISTNASGMKKNRYGNIEDIVDSFVMITPSGNIENIHVFPRTSSGVKVHKLLFGSEGNFGIITQATLRIRKLPEKQKYQSILFKDFKTGIDFLRDVKENQTYPASIRLMDNNQFVFGQALKRAPNFFTKIQSKIQHYIIERVKKFDLSKIAVATIVFEGTKDEVCYQELIIRKLTKKYGGMLGGSGNGKAGYNLTFAIAYIRDFFLDYSILGETYETTVLWDDIEKVCAAVQKKAQELHKKNKFPGMSFIAARITHIYSTGVCIYFTHGASLYNVKNPEAKFSKVDMQIREEILRRGGSISHHHGIGKIRSRFINNVYDATSKQVLEDLKKTLDPSNVFGIKNNYFHVRKS